MAYFLFFFYLFLFLILVKYLDRKNIIKIDPKIAAAAFLLKVVLACLYGYIFLRYYHGDDTWMYHRQGLEETAFLKRDPLHFLHSLIDPTSYSRYMMTTYWQELEYASLIKLLAILNVFSGGEYYVNAVLFSMLTFWGGYFYYRFFSKLFPGKEMLFLLVFFFFIPMVFWTSGIRKDGMIFLSSALFFYCLHRFMAERRTLFLLFSALALLLLSLNRNFVALSMVPASAAWLISHYRGSKPWKTFLFVYLISVFLFFLSSVTGPFNLPASFVQRQADFLALKGGSYVELDKLEPEPLSFLRLLPQAINHVFLRPFPGEYRAALYVFSSVETYLVLLVFLLFFIFPVKGIRQTLFSGPLLAVLFFALTNYLFIGFTIPFLGAIVRYRIVFESLLLAVAAAHVDWKKIATCSFT